MRDVKMPEDKVEPKSEMIVKSVGTATRRRTSKPDPAEVRRIANEEKARAEAAAAADPRRKETGSESLLSFPRNILIFSS
jgi:hypothetical protein